MNCASPITQQQGAPFGRCPDCGGLHELDQPCAHSVAGAMRLVAWVVVAVFVAACSAGVCLTGVA